MTYRDIARTADRTLESLAWAVLALGAILASTAVYIGITADEPWTRGPITATEDWQSIALGIIAALTFLVLAAVLSAFLQLGRAVAGYLQRPEPVTVTATVPAPAAAPVPTPRRTPAPAPAPAPAAAPAPRRTSRAKKPTDPAA
jgi:hypothetical protein